MSVIARSIFSEIFWTSAAGTGLTTYDGEFVYNGTITYGAGL